MYIISYFALALIVFSFTYVYYVAVMSFKRKWKSLSVTTKVIVAPQIIIGWLLDVALNLILSVPFLDFPQELLLTGKLQRIRANGSGYRLRWADEICEDMLNPFDDNHC